MNAYELADALLKNLTMEYDCDKYMEEAANMLRQQAALIDYYKVRDSSYQKTIAELEKEVKELTFKQESLCKIIRMRLNDVPRSQHPSS
jgi:hypothetical protein